MDAGDFSFPEAALLLLGHGSTLNADSSAPTWRHAAEIRRRKLFAEVHVGFWKEEPNFRQALRQTRCARVYVVPNFISSGYFTEQIIPRELGLDGPVTRRDGQEIIYCAPVGLHPSMTETLLQRAREVVESSTEKIETPARTACLFICGHGTSFNDNSTKIIHEQAAEIRRRGLYADCLAVLMEQTPLVRDWRTLTSCPNVIVVPFFIADGLHSFEDIPVLLGLTHDVRQRSFSNPHREEGRRLWYATAIGTEKSIADVIVAQARQPALEISSESCESGATPGTSPLETWLAQQLQGTSPPWTMGQVLISPGFTVRHFEDCSLPEQDLHSISSPEKLRELTLLDEAGRFRPLAAAPNLRRGWIYHAPDLAALRLALDHLYPAEIANAALRSQDRLSVTTWTETARRQTGRFRVVRELDSAALNRLVAETCERGCLKQRLWSPAENRKDLRPGELPLLCPEACNFLVAQARERLKNEPEE